MFTESFEFLLGLENTCYGSATEITEQKHNTTGKLKSPLARILKLHGTSGGKVLNLKLTRFYFFKETKAYS